MYGQPEHKCKQDRSNDKIFHEYKRYKRKKPPPDFSDVIDIHNPEKFHSRVKQVTPPVIGEATSYCKVGLRPASSWQVWELIECPGLLIIRSPFVSHAASSHWVRQALTEYTRKPYPCNIDKLEEGKSLDKEKSLWEISGERSADYSFIRQLSWVHLGYFFDYNTVDYEKKYYGFPDDLAQLTTTIAHSFGYDDYFPETGIVNYYSSSGSMGGHTDHYEDILSQPLISFSFGLPAIFLIGGATRDVQPQALWLRSGDILLMTGDSRIAFHAVPRIFNSPIVTGPSDVPYCPLVIDQSEQEKSETVCELQNNTDQKTDSCCGVEQFGFDSCKCLDGSRSHVWMDTFSNEESWKPFSDYLKNARVNINIRQVHKKPSNNE